MTIFCLLKRTSAAFLLLSTSFDFFFTTTSNNFLLVPSLQMLKFVGLEFEKLLRLKLVKLGLDVQYLGACLDVNLCPNSFFCCNIFCLFSQKNFK